MGRNTTFQETAKFYLVLLKGSVGGTISEAQRRTQRPHPQALHDAQTLNVPCCIQQGK